MLQNPSPGVKYRVRNKTTSDCRGGGAEPVERETQQVFARSISLVKYDLLTQAFRNLHNEACRSRRLIRPYTLVLACP